MWSLPAAQLSLTLALAVPQQPHVFRTGADETHWQVQTFMRAASIIDLTRILICE